jgi:hypothetical protein
MRLSAAFALLRASGDGHFEEFLDVASFQSAGQAFEREVAD